MRIKEIGRRTVDIIRGPKVEGKVAAILPSEIPLSYRYAIKTQNGIVDAHIPSFEGTLIYFYREPFKIGDRLALRAAHAKPWEDGQRV